MGLPTEPVTLSVEQIEELNRRVSALRHDVNNNLTLIIAALELIRHKPELAERMIPTVTEQPMKISQALNAFSAEFENLFGITRDK
ncbi:MAG TPA: hypothetical protein GYA07_01820 [Verrucomicrobia bacterium]|nr:hypothetical protein [Verrucomicrobiota bacterium]HOP97479.1 hypothetical protein [Verrucomicrobiota bacterium]